MEYRICRYCEDTDNARRMIKYSTRSYAHWSCLLGRKSIEDGLEWLRSLPSHEIRNSPVMAIQEWLDARGWTGQRALELLLGMAKAADRKSAKP